MLSLRDLTYTEIAIRIILSVLFGGILGMERGMKNRGAGLRTYIRDFLASVREQNFDPSNLLLQPDFAESADSVTFTITLKSRVARSHEQSMCLLRTLGSVSYIEEL